MMFEDRYYLHLLSAFVRGRLGNENADHPLFQKSLIEIEADEAEELFHLGKAADLSMHKFKRKDGPPRVTQVLGLMHGLQVENMLDIGSGRGAFLWPLLGTFPHIAVHCVDVRADRVRDIRALEIGGWQGVTAAEADITKSDLEDNSFDLVTMLEVLEHIPDCEQALAEVCRIARRAILLSVPSKPDDNPEHIHLFTKQRLVDMFAANGIERVRFHSVLNHIVLLALKS